MAAALRNPNLICNSLNLVCQVFPVGDYVLLTIQLFMDDFKKVASLPLGYFSPSSSVKFRSLVRLMENLATKNQDWKYSFNSKIPSHLVHLFLRLIALTPIIYQCDLNFKPFCHP